MASECPNLVSGNPQSEKSCLLFIECVAKLATRTSGDGDFGRALVTLSRRVLRQHWSENHPAARSRNLS
jgi:hypothetical protein